MKTNPHIKFLSSFARVGALALTLICTSTLAQAGVVLPEVGPRPPGEKSNDNGYLKVFSATEQTEWGFGSYYYPHTSYWLYNSEGKRIKTVENHGSSVDEAPETVQLTPGTYTVKAWSNDDGLVTVPVSIKLGQTTALHLASRRTNSTLGVKEANAVKTPSGQVVGWKS